jgi:rhamnogalacturonyl hydrolase YesR
MMTFRNIVLVFSMLMLHFIVVAQIDLSREMARTIMEQYRDSLVVKKYINHLMQDNLLQSKEEKDIEKANQRPANWNYEIGVVLTGFDRLMEKYRKSGISEIHKKNYRSFFGC